MNFKKFIVIAFCLILARVLIIGQQNHNLYFQHYLAESNLLNPAVPISCRWYIGLPVLSSFHVNYGNSSFAYKQLLNKVSTGSYTADIDGAVNRLHFRNYLGTEVHAQLLALGYRRGNYSFMFTLTEKNNLPFIYPKQPIELAWYGNSLFEGENAGFKGMGIFFNHYREYALSFSKLNSSGIYFGGRAKLLFGKLNVTTRTTNINLLTDETSFALDFSGDLLVHTSMPVIVDTSQGLINGITYDESTSIIDLALNRKNPGFGIDLGIIYPISDQIELSASIIDLGFIRWRSNLNSFGGEGNFVFNGVLWDSISSANYVDHLRESFIDSMQMTVSEQKYTSMLSTRLLAGGTYQLNDKISMGLHGEALLYRTKLIPSATYSVLYNPIGNIRLIGSYTLQYYSLKSIGLGISVGKGPVQAYIMSDNVPGTIWLMSSRNINLRFGLNINLGCNVKSKEAGKTIGSGKGQVPGNCFWAEKQLQKTIRKKRKSR